MAADDIEFRVERLVNRQHDPRKDFALGEIASEIRYDPLTGNTARICHLAMPRAPETDLGPVIEASLDFCPFCPDKVLQVTPRFPEDLVPGGRLQRGDAVLFPNLFPYDEVSAVATVSRQHFLPMDDIPPATMIDGLGVARDFFRLLEADGAGATGAADQDGVRYGMVTWNHMPPSGGSQVHPHFQVIHTGNPGNASRRRLRAEAAWQERHGSAWMADLMAAERARGERWIGEAGGVCWTVPWTPVGVLGDCMAVFPEVASIADLDDGRIAAFADGLRRVLRGFAGLGIWSFNLAFMPGPSGQGADTHWLVARLLPRIYFNPVLHVTDASYMHLLLEEPFSMVFPEDTAAMLREAWTAPA